MDTFSVLNYQGSKKNILDFLHSNIDVLLNNNSTLLDIFSGTCSVGYSYKSKCRVYANDSELYAFCIAKALLSSGYSGIQRIKSELKEYFDENKNSLNPEYLELAKQETSILNDEKTEDLINLYLQTPTIWNNPDIRYSTHTSFELFTTYYSNSYFGICQAIEIDSIRYAIEKFRDSKVYYALLTSLYYAMKECVFSKDGHMAQPLDFEKNHTRMIKQRKKSIYDLFFTKFDEFYSQEFVTNIYKNKVFNMDFSDLIKEKSIIKDVSLIYADPPYTDMQYSRYYHLLNTVTEYNYPSPTINNQSYTKGLYVNNRFQSQLSAKSKSLDSLMQLIQFSHKYHKDLVISFGYPEDIQKQKSDRYVMNIDELIASCKTVYGLTSVEVANTDYTHSNNRNSIPKRVKEYLIICKGR